MRRIDRSKRFLRDLRKLSSSPYSKTLQQRLGPVLEALATDEPLPASMREHALRGDWRGYRECHVLPDVLLIYRLEGDDVLHLARLGSHSDVF